MAEEVPGDTAGCHSELGAHVGDLASAVPAVPEWVSLRAWMVNRPRAKDVTRQ